MTENFNGIHKNLDPHLCFLQCDLASEAFLGNVSQLLNATSGELVHTRAVTNLYVVCVNSNNVCYDDHSMRNHLGQRKESFSREARTRVTTKGVFRLERC